LIQGPAGKAKQPAAYLKHVSRHKEERRVGLDGFAKKIPGSAFSGTYLDKYIRQKMSLRSHGSD
jgi:hypothetical protein